ncbi:MAG: helix-turn-helix transcriptional regulator [Streptosporangiaceae bacterium]|nr:helix-turn-helix transcriptional regulator [Streptosporangiaceae bacterium]
MATETARRRVRAEIARLARAGLDNDGFRLAAADVLRKAVGFDWWCWTLLDPAADLPTRYLSDNPIIGGAQRRFYRMLPAAAQPSPEWQSIRPVTILSAATGGDLNRSKLWRDLLGPRGGGDQLVARLTAGGISWAHLDLGREQSSGWFTPDDADFMASLAPLLATRLRAGLRTPASHSKDDNADSDSTAAGAEPGTIILDRDLALVAATSAAWRWIDRLGLQRPSDEEPLPGFVYAAATRIAVAPDQPAEPIAVRLQATDGSWVVARVAPVADSPRLVGGFVVTIEPARAGDLAPLLMRAWGLSARERDVAALAIAGLPSPDIAAALFISPHTVRDHLKSVFAKTGVNCRRDLTAAFTGHAAVPDRR